MRKGQLLKLIYFHKLSVNQRKLTFIVIFGGLSGTFIANVHCDFYDYIAG
jgi:hypothetical protein